MPALTVSDMIRQMDECTAFLRERLPFIPALLIQLGTGLGGLARQAQVALTLPYSEIPHFPVATVGSHRGNLIIGQLQGVPVAILQGRTHCYEGYTAREVAFPVRALALLGARTLIITNAAGGLNPDFAAGSIMIVNDHLNFLGDNPLRGPNIEAWGPRFPDFSVPYSPRLIALALECARSRVVPAVVVGTYACIPGPSLETPAETRWLRGCGADAVGMSSLPEIIVARHAGVEALALSVIANVNNPEAMQPILLDQIIAAAATAGVQLERLLMEIIPRLNHET